MIRAIIFDCDGVILDSNEAYEKMYEELFAKYGVRKTKRDIYPHFGESPMHIIKVFFPGADREKIFADYKSQVMSPGIRRMIWMHPGASRAISYMSRRYKVAVVSGALHSRLVSSLSEHRVLSYFACVIGSDDVKNAKPNPEALLKAIRRLNVKKNEAIFVGDAPNDLRAAKRAGIKFAAVLTGVFDRKAARKMRADFILRSINDVPNLVRKLNKK